MKKVLFLIVGGFVFMFTSVVYAGWGDPGELPVKDSNDKDSLSFKPSKNVSLYWDVDSNQQSYALGSKHTQGNRVFATTNASTTTYYQESNSYIGKTGNDLKNTITMPSPGSTVSGWNSI